MKEGRRSPGPRWLSSRHKTRAPTSPRCSKLRISWVNRRETLSKRRVISRNRRWCKYLRPQRATSPLQGSLCSNGPSKRALVAAQRKRRWLPHLCWHSSISSLPLNISRSSSPFWPQTWAPNRSSHRHRRLWRLVMPLGALEQVWEASWFMTAPRELL